MNSFRHSGGRRAREGGEATYIYHTFPSAVAEVAADLTRSGAGINFPAPVLADDENIPRGGRSLRKSQLSVRSAREHNPSLHVRGSRGGGNNFERVAEQHRNTIRSELVDAMRYVCDMRRRTKPAALIRGGPDRSVECLQAGQHFNVQLRNSSRTVVGLAVTPRHLTVSCRFKPCRARKFGSTAGPDAGDGIRRKESRTVGGDSAEQGATRRACHSLFQK